MGSERRLVTVLFADLSGFTALAETMDPEDVHAFLEPTMAGLGEAVTGLGGTVMKWMGDGFMAVFGVPVAHPDDPERAVRAALACRDAVARRKADHPALAGPDTLHAGVHTGEVLVVRTPAGPDLVGDTVNTAARLMGLAPPGIILVGESTRELTAHAGTYIEWAPVRVKGKAEAIQAHQLTGVSEIPGGRAPSGGRAPFVGRDRELEWLRARLAAVWSTRESRVVAVAGDSGVGKTRLRERFAEVEMRGLHLVGTCAPYGEHGAWHPIASALAAVTGVDGTEVGGDARARVEAAVASAMPSASDGERSATVHGLTLALGLGGQPAPPASTELNLDVAVAFRQMVGALAEDRPVVLSIDDAQWADPQVRAFLTWCREEPWNTPVLILCAAWPEALEWLKPDDEDALALGSLDEEAARALLQALLPGDLPPSLTRDLLARAGGNALFLEEIVHLLVENDTLERFGGVWRVTGGDTLTIPQTVQLVVAARLDTLARDELAVLRDAATAGDVFWDRLLRALGWGPEVDGVLERLEKRDFIRRRPASVIRDAVEFEFKHEVIREVAYGSLPRADRANRHLAIGGWLRATAFSPEDEPVDALAFHFGNAVSLRGEATGYNVRTALEYLKRAGERAARQFAYRHAARQLGRGLELAAGLDADPETVDGELLAETRLAHAEALANLSQFEEGRRAAEAVLELAAKAGRPDWEVRALLVLGWIESDVARVAEARELLMRATEMARAAGDGRSEAIALYETAYTWRFAEPERERERLADAARAFETIGDHWWELRCYQDLAWVSSPLGGEWFDGPYGRLEALAERTPDPRTIGSLRRAWGFNRFYAGDLAAARTALAEAVRLGRDAGDPDIEVECRFPLALIDLAEGRLDAAAGHADRIIQTGLRRSFRRTISQGRVLRARVASRIGDADRAREELREAEELLRQIEAGLDLVEVWLAQAEVALDRGEWDEAGAAAGRFLEDLRDLGPLLRPYGLMLLGQARLGAGDLPGATEQLDVALAEANEAGNELVAVRAALLRAEAEILQGRDPGALPDGDPSPAGRALRAELRLLAGDADAREQAVAAWKELGETVWTERARSLRGS
jgi:class 3 adenylate cyclase/tetratricopeptide (TPR) repeat protein